MKHLWMVALLLVGLTLVGCHSVEAQPAEVAQHVQAQEQANAILFFSATWCGPCQRMKATTLKDERVVAVANQFKVVNLDWDQNRSLAMKLGVRNIPTVLVGNLSQDGKWSEHDRTTGYVDARTFESFLRKHTPR